MTPGRDIEKCQGPVFLVGLRASGKTTVGRELARALGWPHVDTDDLVTAHGETVASIVAREGWEGFRRREHEALCAARRVRQVVSTGGGMVLLEENRRLMRENGVTLYLYAPAEVLAARLAANPREEQRPSLTGRPLAEEVQTLLEERDPLYRESAFRVLDATAPLPDIVAAAVAVLR